MQRGLRTELVVIVAMAVALPLLAFLQYRWIGDISRTEREQLRANMRQAASRFAADFDNQIYGVLQSMPRRRQRMEGFDVDEYGIALMRGAESGHLPKLLRAVYFLPAHDEPIQLFDPEEEHFKPSSWPESLATLKGLLERRRESPFAVDASVPAIAMPRPRPRPREGRGASRPPRDRFGPPGMGFGEGRPPASSWLILEFDKDYLQKEAMPEVARRSLGFDYTVQVAAESDGSLFFQSDTPPAGEAELRLPLRLIRPGPGPGMGMGIGMGMPGGMGFGGIAPAPWEMRIWSRNGSLETVVNTTRWRNLAVSGGILLVLCAGFAVLLRSARHERRLSQLQMEFVAGVSHELRTPLAVIRSAGENLADGVVTRDDQIRRYGDLVRNEGQRLSAMVEQVLRFAGIQSGKAKYDLMPTDVGSLLIRAVDAAHEDYLRAGRTVDCSTPTGLPQARADAVALEQCIRNLLENSLKHAEGATHVEAVEENRSIVITVCDGGPGIDPADLPHVFEPFYRGRRAVTDQIPGAGLGLSLIKRIIEAHGGSIAVSRRAGEGSRFVLRVPAAMEKA